MLEPNTYYLKIRRLLLRQTESCLYLLIHDKCMDILDIFNGNIATLKSTVNLKKTINKLLKFSNTHFVTKQVHRGAKIVYRNARITYLHAKSALLNVILTPLHTTITYLQTKNTLFQQVFTPKLDILTPFKYLDTLCLLRNTLFLLRDTLFLLCNTLLQFLKRFILIQFSIVQMRLTWNNSVLRHQTEALGSVVLLTGIACEIIHKANLIPVLNHVFN